MMNKREMRSNIIFRVGALSAVIVWGGVWGRYLAIADQGTLLPSSEGLGSPGKAIYRPSDIAPQHGAHSHP